MYLPFGDGRLMAFYVTDYANHKGNCAEFMYDLYFLVSMKLK